MSYTVDFVGLACFQQLSGEKGRRALLPDGRFPDDLNIQPHVASISVKTEDLLGAEKWNSHQVTSDRFETEFLFPPSTIVLPSAGTPGDYSETDFSVVHDLNEVNQEFRLGKNANWIGSVEVRQGAIAPFVVPGFVDDSTAPLQAELTVLHEVEIVITVTPRKGWPVRTIALKPGSEIAIINTSRGLAPKSQQADHFQIYAELSSVPVTLKAPVRKKTAVRVETSKSGHPAFRQARPATMSNDCVFTTSP